ncbi:hypothetical protein [Erythrobacter sanguineus]|uniref:Uncharacterized protein n=1 Tax=Erythrobacter sanguineus TaxID=198312 RepID=A0A1M7SQA5_9SPHN|nr:hypothetical protein [Erythrobacter sanguineus]SHN60693.1 hypothetical protein SAMN02745193_02173 [Erythrobacter sanguineus]
MSIRLAPAHDHARTAGRHAAGRGLVARVRVMAANDNGDQPGRDAPGAFDPVLVAALHHFARHGLDSARMAHAEATRARLEGNAPGAAEWIAITGMFDRRLAASANREPIPA